MSKIKLLEIEKVEIKGKVVRRFQSQLQVGTDSADFILEEGKIKNYGYGEKGFNFYDYNEPYEIVKSKKDMQTQIL